MSLHNIVKKSAKWLALAPLVFNSYLGLAQHEEPQDTSFATGTIEFLNAKTSKNVPGVAIQATLLKTDHKNINAIYKDTADANGEIDFEWISHRNPVSVYTPEPTKFSIGPNPANYRDVHLSQPGTYQIRTYDVQGNVVLDQTEQGKSFHLEFNTLTPGMYFIEITDVKNHKQIAVAKQLISGDASGVYQRPQESIQLEKEQQQETSEIQQLNKRDGDVTYRVVYSKDGYKTDSTDVELVTGDNGLEELVISPYDTLYYNGRIIARDGTTSKPSTRILTPIETGDKLVDSTYTFDENYNDRIILPVNINTEGDAPTNATGKYRLQIIPPETKNPLTTYLPIDTIIDLTSGIQSNQYFELTETTPPDILGKKRLKVGIAEIDNGTTTNWYDWADDALVLYKIGKNGTIDSARTQNGFVTFDTLFNDGDSVYLAAGFTDARKDKFFTMSNGLHVVKGASIQNVLDGDTIDYEPFGLSQREVFSKKGNRMIVIDSDMLEEMVQNPNYHMGKYDSAYIKIATTGFTTQEKNYIRAQADTLNKYLDFTFIENNKLTKFAPFILDQSKFENGGIYLVSGSNNSNLQTFLFNGTYYTVHNEAEVDGSGRGTLKEYFQWINGGDVTSRDTSIMRSSGNGFTVYDVGLTNQHIRIYKFTVREGQRISFRRQTDRIIVGFD